MVALTLRATKGSALTHNEVDANFTALNAELTDMSTIVESIPALDTDQTLSADSDLRVASQKATKAYVDALGAASVGANDGEGGTRFTDVQGFIEGVNEKFFGGVTGEVGVVNWAYPPGDVRRYGVFPDAVDLAGLNFTSGSPTVSAPAGTFNAGMVGMLVCSPNMSGSPLVTPKLITAVATDGSSATMAGNAVSSQSGASARVGTWWESTHSAYIAAILENSVLPGIEIYFPPGNYATSLNFGTDTSGGKFFFDNVGLSGVLHLLADSGYPSTADPLTDVRLRGHITLYDRLGTIGLQHSDLRDLRVVTKSDATKNTYGLLGRGAHLFTGTIGNDFGPIIIEDTTVGDLYNCDGGFVCDDSTACDNHFSSVWVKDSAGHGFYQVGPRNTFDEVRVDGWGYGTADRQIQETQSLAQCQELCGAWLHRNSGCYYKHVRITRKTGRTNAIHDLRTEDHASSGAGDAFPAIPRIDVLILNGVAKKGVNIGDPAYPYKITELSVGTIMAMPGATAGMTASYSCINLNANSAPASYGRTKLLVEKLVMLNSTTAANSLLQVAAGTEIDVDVIDTARGGNGFALGNAGQVLSMKGRGRVGRIEALYAGADTGSTQVVWQPDGASSCGRVHLDAGGGVPHVIALDLTGATDTDIGPVSLSGFRPTYAIVADGTTNVVLRLGTCVGYSNQGTCLSVNSNTNLRVEGGSISTFSVGTAGSGNTNCLATNVNVTGNSTNTSLAAGQFVKDATSSAFTL